MNVNIEHIADCIMEALGDILEQSKKTNELLEQVVNQAAGMQDGGLAVAAARFKVWADANAGAMRKTFTTAMHHGNDADAVERDGVTATDICNAALANLGEGSVISCGECDPPKDGP